METKENDIGALQRNFTSVKSGGEEESDLANKKIIKKIKKELQQGVAEENFEYIT